MLEITSHDLFLGQRRATPAIYLHMKFLAGLKQDKEKQYIEKSITKLNI